MKKETNNIVMRLEKEMGRKMMYIAEYECRTRSQEITKLMKDRIRSFEAEHGEIPIPLSEAEEKE